MKRFLSICFIATLISILSGNLIFNIYKKDALNVIDVYNTEEVVYMLLYGSYNSKEKEDNLDLSSYIVIKDNNYYEVYIGISKSLENANIIRGIYKDLGYSIYIRDKTINNIEFIDYLNNNEIDLENKTDNEIIELEKNILNKYKELNE